MKKQAAKQDKEAMEFYKKMREKDEQRERRWELEELNRRDKEEKLAKARLWAKERKKSKGLAAARAKQEEVQRKQAGQRKKLRKRPNAG